MRFSKHHPHEAIDKYKPAGEAENVSGDLWFRELFVTFGKVRFLHCAYLEIIATVTSLGTGWVNKFAFGTVHRTAILLLSIATGAWLQTCYSSPQ